MSSETIRWGDPVADARILGGGDFVAHLLTEAEARVRHTLRVTRPRPALATLARQVATSGGLPVVDLRSGRRTRRLLCQLAIRHLGYPGAAVARFLGVTASAANWATWTQPDPDVKELT